MCGALASGQERPPDGRVVGRVSGTARIELQDDALAGLGMRLQAGQQACQDFGCVRRVTVPERTMGCLQHGAAERRRSSQDLRCAACVPAGIDDHEPGPLLAGLPCPSLTPGP
jgi:hypothetical protein